jgi:hypothetical protein
LAPKNSATSTLLPFSSAPICVFHLSRRQIVKTVPAVLAVDGGGGSIGDGASDTRGPQRSGHIFIAAYSDGQPDDESAPFSYFSIALVGSGESEPQKPDGSSVGFVELYGSADHEGSMLVLKPGEWIRVRANVKLHKWPPEPTSARFRGVFWLRKDTFHPHPGGSSTESQNLYPNETPTPAISVYLHPVRSEHPAN